MQAEATLWCDVYNASWTKVGDGPIPLISASITRAFDGAGSITIDAPSTDKRAIQWLTNERRVKIYQIENDTLRTVGAGIIRKVTKRSTAGGYTRSCSGPDAFDELKRVSTKLNRKYDNLPVADVADSLSVLAGWTSTVESGVDDLITARFDGPSILKALQTMTEQVGLHLRLSASIDRQVEIGAFGQSIGLYITTMEMLPQAAYANAEIALLDSLTVTSESEALCNWMIPIGSGEGESALTLEHCTRTSPYPIETTVVDGETLYYIQDSYSYENYGPIEKVGTFKNIAPISNGDAATELAANALYDAAVAYLQRACLPQTVYAFSIKKCATVVRPGDKVHLAYRGVIRDDSGVELASEAVEGDFYVLKVTERLGEGGATITLDVSTIDKQMEDIVSTIIGGIEDIKLRDMKPALTNFRQSEGGEREMQQWDGHSTYIHTALFELPIDSTVTDVTLVLLRFSSLPMRSRNAYLGGTFLNTFMVADNANNPQDISLFINDVDVTSALHPSGVYNPAPGNATVDNELLDITDYIRNASGGMKQTHRIEFRISERNRAVEIPGYGSCTALYGNMGLIRATITLLGTSQSIKSDS